MIQTLYQIGAAIHNDDEYSRFFQPWGNPFPGREDDAKVIVAEIENGSFIKVVLENFRSDYLGKYLFREGSTKGRATNSVPTVPFIDIDTSFAKVEQSFKNYKHAFAKSSELTRVKAALSEINLEKGTSYLFTFKIDGKYLGEYSKYRDIFIQNAYRGFFEKNYSGIKMSRKDDYVCALSGIRTTVYGFVDVMGFTVNDDSFMRNGFDQAQSYKMFPVSSKAAVILSGITSLVFTNDFSKHFSGSIKYIILPKFIGNNRPELIKEVFELFKERNAFNITSENSAKGSAGFIKGTEDMIEEIILDERLHSQDIFYDILFYEDKKSQLSLLLQVSDVQPSRLRTIMEVKKGLEKFYAPLTNFDDGSKHYNFHINLVTIKDFLLTEQGKKQIPHPYFFRVTEALFYGQKINQKTFVHFLLLRFRKLFKERHGNEYAFPTAVKEGFVIFQFLFRQNLKPKSSNQMNLLNTKDSKVALNALQFIDQHPDFFNVEFKKGAFIFGCLVSKLLRKQPNNAFLKQLNDLYLDRKIVEKKFPKLINKLRQYDVNYKEISDMEVVLATSMMDQNPISKEDISLAVTLGLVLQKEFDVRSWKEASKDIPTNIETQTI